MLSRSDWRRSLPHRFGSRSEGQGICWSCATATRRTTACIKRISANTDCALEVISDQVRTSAPSTAQHAAESVRGVREDARRPSTPISWATEQAEEVATVPLSEFRARQTAQFLQHPGIAGSLFAPCGAR
jgi:hypothetical protein